MTTVTIDNPEKVLKKTVGQNGQVYIGRDLAGKRVELVVSEVQEE